MKPGRASGSGRPHNGLVESNAAHQARVLGTPWPGVFRTQIASARSYARHWHATYGFGLVEEGAQRSASGRGQVDASAGDLITTGPGEVHDGRPIGTMGRRWQMIYLEPEVMARLAKEAAPSGWADVAFERPVIHDGRVRQALWRLFRCLDAWPQPAPPSGAQLMACEEALVEVCTQLLERHSTLRPARVPDAALRAVRERLADERLDPPTLAELAAMTSLSRYQVLRRFAQEFGMPPHAWLLRQRAERARGLITAGIGLAQAAADSGFADQSHMHRVFTRQFGFTPGAWRLASSR